MGSDSSPALAYPGPRLAMTDSTHEIHVEDLGRLRRVTGWVTLAGPFLFAALALGAGLACGMRVPLAVGLFLLLETGVLWSLHKTLTWRQRAFAARLADPAADVGRVAFGARFLPFLFALLGLALPFYTLWAQAAVEAWEWTWLEPWAALRAPDSDAAESALYGWILVALAALAALFAQYFATVPATLAPEARGVACWFRATVWVALAGAASLLVRAWYEPWYEEEVAAVLFGVGVFLAGELMLRVSWTRWLGFYDGRPHPGASVATDAFSLRLLFSRFYPVGSLFAVLAEAFGIDLRGAWALTFMRRSLVPLTLLLAAVGWLSTAFVMVEASDLGVVERFGVADEEPLEPGLHFVLPWPMHRVSRVPVHRVQTIPIGYSGARAGASMLWTVEHADEEYKLLLGDGRDLVTVNAALHYRVRDPFQYVYSSQNPDEVLAMLADRALMQATVDRSLDGVLSENLAALGDELSRSIQDACNARQLGFEIVDFTLTGLHPPVSVSADYQAVVAAQIDRTTRKLEAEAYREEERPKADGEVARLRNGALEHGVTRLATARGEAVAFDALRESYEASPELFRLMRYLAAVEARLAGKKFHVLDHTIERDHGAIWLLE